MDQFYFEEGYLEASYFTVIREAVAAFTVTASQTAAVDIADATGYYIPDYIVTDYFEAGGQVREADAAFTVTATQTAVVERILQAVATVAVSATKSCTVIRIRDSAAEFTAAFAPTLVAEGIKNSTAILDSVSSLSVDAVVNRSANVLLEHIANLNAMAIKEAAGSAAFSTTSTTSTTSQKITDVQANITATATVSADGFDVKFADAAISARSQFLVSRNTGTGRPRTFTTNGTVNFTTSSKFGSHALNCPIGNNHAIASATKDWNQWRTIDLWAYVTAPGGGGGFTMLKTSQWQLFEFTQSNAGSWRVGLQNGGNQAVSTVITDTGWVHIRLIREASAFTVYVNGTRLSWFSNNITTTNISAVNETLKIGNGSDYFSEASILDELLITDNLLNTSASSSITVPTSPWTFSSQSNVYLLSHFNNVLDDDVSITQSATSALSLAATTSALANANTKLVSADLSAMVNVSAQGDQLASASAALVSTSTISVIIGSVKDSITLNAGVFTVNTQESRLRDASCAVTSAFTPTLNAVATRSGDIALSSAFALTADANSFTDSGADIAAVFAVSAAVDGITRLGASALSSEFNQTNLVGKLQSVNVPITSAFTTVMNVSYFEGTSLIAPMAAVMSVSAVKTARITKTLSAVTSVSADVFVAEFADYTVITPITDRGLIHFNTATAVDEFGGTISPNTGYTSVTGKFGNGLGSPSSSRTLTNGSTYANLYDQSVWTVDFWYKPNDLTTSSFVMPISGILALSNVAQSGTYQANGGDQNIMLGWQQNSLVSANQANGYFYFGYHWSDPNRSNITTYTYSGGVATSYKHVAMVFENLGSNNIRTTFYIDGVQQGVTTKNYGAYNPTTSSLVITPTTFRVTDRDTQGSFTKSYSGQLDELRFLPFQAYTANFTPETQEYNPPTQIVDNYKVAYARLDSRSTLSSSGISVVNIQAALFAGTFTQTAIIGSIRSTSSNQSSAFTTFINAGKNVEISSDLASQSTIAVAAVKAVRAQSDLNVIAAQSTANDRIRTTTVEMATTANISITAVKTTGVVVNSVSAATQSVTGFRIQQGQASISAMYSQLTVAVQNATGTVLLESVTQMQITAEKNAVGVIDISAQFTQSTDSADSKTVRVSSDIAAEFTQTVEGLRIQPAGADFTAQFTQNTDTAFSKIARVNADFSVSVTQITDIDRFRDGIALQASLGTLSCSIDRLRQANSNLSAVIYDFTASPTFIIRVTADFSAFNTQLTVGEIINIDPALQLKIEPETRIRKIPQETRVLSIESETRVNIIED